MTSDSMKHRDATQSRSVPTAPAAALTPFTPVTPVTPVVGGLQALRRVVASDLLRCGLPHTLGGIPGSLADLHAGAITLARDDPAAVWVLWAQRLAIEALVRSTNVGLMEYVLPDLLCGDRAGSMPLPSSRAPLVGTDSGRGWRLSGRFDCVPNQQWVHCSIVVPVRLQGDDIGWVLLRSEEDGLDISHLDQGAAPVFSRSASITAHRVFFREDEWLGAADLADRLAPVAAALAPALGSL